MSRRNTRPQSPQRTMSPQMSHTNTYNKNVNISGGYGGYGGRGYYPGGALMGTTTGLLLGTAIGSSINSGKGSVYQEQPQQPAQIYVVPNPGQTGYQPTNEQMYYQGSDPYYQGSTPYQY